MIDLLAGDDLNVGDMKYLPTDITDFSYNGQYLLRSGVTTQYNLYPDFPVELVKFNGATWSPATGSLPSASVNWSSIATNGTRAVTVGYTSNSAAYSDNGQTWTAATLPSSRNWAAVAYGNGKFVAVASGSSVAAYSTDGVSWTETALPSSSLWSSVTYAAGKFVAVSATSGVGAYSADGVTWFSSNTQNPLNDVAYIGGTFYGVGNVGTASRSTDGVTWTSFALGSGTTYQAIAGGNGVIIAIDSNNQGYRKSTDGGATWTSGNFDVALSWRDIVYTNGLFVVIAQSTSTAASIRTSRDGTAWTVRSAPSASNWRAITFSGKKFIVVGQNTSQVALSNDGTIGAETYTQNLYVRVK